GDLPPVPSRPQRGGDGGRRGPGSGAGAALGGRAGRQPVFALRRGGGGGGLPVRAAAGGWCKQRGGAWCRGGGRGALTAGGRRRGHFHGRTCRRVPTGRREEPAQPCAGQGVWRCLTAPRGPHGMSRGEPWECRKTRSTSGTP